MARDFSLSCSAWLAKEDCDRKWNVKEILAGKKKKSGNEIKLSTKWLTKGRIELLMEEEESLLRRAIAAIAISLSLGVVCGRECLEFYETLFYLERGVGVGGLVAEVDL